MASGELAALYSGMKYIGDEEIDLRQESCERNPRTASRCATYHYSSPYGFSIDVPAELAGSYDTTLGFKANHSFRNNCGFVAFDHPRFGFIVGIVALADVVEDEELFVYYGYQVPV
jgi:hypothetical protein